MKNIDFKESNRTLSPSNKQYSDKIGKVSYLHIFSDGEQCVSCWKMTWKERFSALFFGRVWVAVASGKTQPPIYAQTSKSYLENSK